MHYSGVGSSVGVVLVSVVVVGVVGAVLIIVFHKVFATLIDILATILVNTAIAVDLTIFIHNIVEK